MNNNKRILFYGTPDFAVATLEQLIMDGFNIIGVVTSVDKPAGRGKHIQQSDVKVLALANNLKVYQPENLKSESFLNILRELKPDIQVVVAFRMLPEVVWNFPALGTYNLHASLLPNYRGAAPINWAIINGETETGVTTFKLKHEIDTGDIAMQQKCSILPEDDFGTLYNKLKIIGGKLMSETLKQLFSNQLQLRQQVYNGSEKEAPKINKSDMQLDYSKKALEIHNLVRGFSPAFGVFTKINDKIFKIYQSKLTNISSKEDKMVLKIIENELFLKTSDYYLQILSCQLEGKRRMTAKEFILGVKL